jgi:hypothetical protein
VSTLIRNIEWFASVSAALDDPSAARADVLNAVGLGESEWQNLRVAILPLLAAGDDPRLAVRFARAYATARQGPRDLAQQDVPLTPRTAAPAWMEMEGEATVCDAPPSSLFGLDATTDMALPLAPALPFVLPQSLSPQGEGEPPPAPPSSTDSVDVTLPVPGTPPPPVLPFVQPEQPARAMRLEMFDRHTGERLAVPRWAPEPETPHRY